MKIPCLYLALGACLGTMAAMIQPMATPVVAASFLSGLPLLWLCRGRSVFALLFTGMLALLFAFNFIRADSPHAQSITLWADSAAAVNLEGIVLSGPVTSQRGKRRKAGFVVEARNIVEALENGTKKYPVRGKVQVFLYQTGVLPGYGDSVLLHGELKRPLPAPHPYGFDYRRFLKSRGIETVFTGYGFKSVRILQKGKEANPFLLWIENLRSQTEAKIEDIWKEEYQFLFKALMLGKRDGLPENLRESFAKTGTAHLLAISGLHVSLIGGTVFVLLLLCGYRRRGAAVLSIFAVMVYVLMAGAAVPVRRAGLMLSAVFLSFLLEREIHALNLFFFALFLFILQDPRVLQDVSFQLSFLSVLSLLLWAPLLGRRPPWLTGMIQTALVTVGTFPLIIYYFSVFPFSGILVNAAAVPLFYAGLGSAFAALILSDIPFLGKLAALIAQGSLAAALRWIEFWALLPGAYAYMRRPLPAHFLFYYAVLGVFWTTLQAGKKVSAWAKGLAGALVFTGILSFWFFPFTPAFSLTLLEGTNGTFAHLSWESRHWLVTSSARVGIRNAKRTLIPYFRGQGISALEAVLWSVLPAKGGLWPEKHHAAPAVRYQIYPFSRRGEFPGPWKDVGLQPGDEAEIGKAGRLRVLARIEDMLVLHASYRDFNILILAAWHEQMADIPDEVWKQAPVDILCVLSGRHLQEESFLAFVERLSLSAVVIPDGMKDGLSNVRFYALREHRMLRFELSPHHKKIKVFSHLQGKLEPYLLPRDLFDKTGRDLL